mmetsp:Transcript_39455/g.82503  ORF Transcript_39455/g.82503 Transcript_39455/m.82503 type:complete len:241 (-) Transcript_39455:382-1104(-)
MKLSILIMECAHHDLFRRKPLLSLFDLGPDTIALVGTGKHKGYIHILRLELSLIHFDHGILILQLLSLHVQQRVLRFEILFHYRLQSLDHFFKLRILVFEAADCLLVLQQNIDLLLCKTLALPQQLLVFCQFILHLFHLRFLRLGDQFIPLRIEVFNHLNMSLDNVLRLQNGSSIRLILRLHLTHLLQLFFILLQLDPLQRAVILQLVHQLLQLNLLLIESQIHIRRDPKFLLPFHASRQ